MKYTTIFSSVIKPLVSEEKDKYLAMASLIDIGDFVPNVDTESNIDLLPIAFNSCVINRVNKNGDVIDTETAMAVYENFINKPINVEHNRDRVVGVILTAGFSEFGTDKQLTKEQVEGSAAPFNITLGGVIWKVVSSELADVIEESNDPTSEYYQTVSASWELGFSDFDLVAIRGEEKNIENGEIISDPKKVEELKDTLRSFGGTGELEDGRKIYRRVFEGVVPLGIGLTETPAADVIGVAIKNEEEEEAAADEKAGYPPNCNEGYEAKDGKCVKVKDKQSSAGQEEKIKAETLEITSLSSDNNVNNTKEVVMKIESLKDINDESLKSLEAGVVHEFIQDEIRKASEKFATEKQEQEEALKQAQEQNETISKDHDALKDELGKVNESLKELETEKTERENQERFNERMASFDEEYELSEDDRKVIASDVKDLDDEQFGNYQEKMKVLLNSKNKEVLAEVANEQASGEAAEGTKAPEGEAKEEETKEIVDEVIDNAEVESNTVTSTIDAETPTVYEKYKDAFSIEQFEIN